MKQKVIRPVFVIFFFASLLAVLGTACSREHQCKCTNSDNPNDEQFKVFVVDGSISCDDLEMMAVEEHDDNSSLRRVDTVRLKCRDFGE